MAALVRQRTNLLSTAIRLMIRSASTNEYEGPHVECVTHTGQVWDRDDYRRVRFIGKDKLLNQQFAINLIAEDPVVVVNDNHVFSDSGGALGHPKVYINLDKPEVGVCGYSGRKFIQAKYYNRGKHGNAITYDDYLMQVRPSED